jgi:hypothetical protein
MAIKSYNDARGTGIAIKQVKCLNNTIEQNHRAIKRITRAALGFKAVRRRSPPWRRWNSCTCPRKDRWWSRKGRKVSPRPSSSTPWPPNQVGDGTPRGSSQNFRQIRIPSPHKLSHGRNASADTPTPRPLGRQGWSCVTTASCRVPLGWRWLKGERVCGLTSAGYADRGRIRHRGKVVLNNARAV